MSNNLASLIVMFCSGVAVGTAIDGLRFFTVKVRLPLLAKLANALEIILWAFLGCATFYLLLVVKHGDWRVVDSLAQIAGIFAYNFIFYKIIRFIGMILVNIFIRPFLFVGHLFVLLVRAFAKVIVKILKFIGRLMRRFKKSSTIRLSKSK